MAFLANSADYPSLVAAAGTLTGATLAAGVTASSLTSVGTLTGGATGAGFTVALGTSTITGILGSANGGTANGFTKFSGATTSEKTYTLPNASATILTDNAAVTVAQGGSGRATGTTAYSLVATGTTATGAQQTLASGATTEILVGGGASALPVWTTASGTGAPVRGTSPTIATPVLTLQQGTAPTPTAEGDIQWDTDDNWIVVGDGVGQKIFKNESSGATAPSPTGLTVVGTPTYALNYTKQGKIVAGTLSVSSTVTTAATAGTTTFPLPVAANILSNCIASDGNSLASLGVGTISGSTLFVPTWTARASVIISFNYQAAS